MASLMSPSQQQTSLAVADDTMEISSDRGAGDDHIDIDIDLDGYQDNVANDEIMFEEEDTITAEAQRPVHDDFMMDGDGLPHDGDEGMMEDEHLVRDEHIYDANPADQDIDLVDDVRVSHHRESSSLPDVAITGPQDSIDLFPSDAAVGHVQEQIPQTVDAPDVGPVAEGHHPALQDNIYSDDLTAVEPSVALEQDAAPGGKDTLPQTQEEEENSLDTTDEAAVNFPDTDQDPVGATELEHNETALEYGPDDSSAIQDGSETNHEHIEEAPVEHEERPYAQYGDDFIHPVSIFYEGAQYNLFNSSDSSITRSYILPDSSTAHGLLKDLISACKGVLLGQPDEGLELELEIPALGLYITEDSKHASALSLTDIVETYLQLSWNDEIDEPEPLAFSVTMRDSFDDRMKKLREAADAGKGLSQMTSTDHTDDLAEAAEQHLTGQGGHTSADSTIASDQHAHIDGERSDHPGSDSAEEETPEGEQTGADNFDTTEEPREGFEDDLEAEQGDEEDGEEEEDFEETAEETFDDFAETEDQFQNGDVSGSTTVRDDDEEQELDAAGTEDTTTAEDTFNDQEHQEEHELELGFAEDARALNDNENPNESNSIADLEAPSIAAGEGFDEEDADQEIDYEDDQDETAEEQISAFEEGILEDGEPPEPVQAVIDLEEDWEAEEDQLDINDFYPEETYEPQLDPVDLNEITNEEEDWEPDDQYTEIPPSEEITSASRKRSRAEGDDAGETDGNDAKKARAD